MPGDPGATVVNNSCAFYTLRARLRVQWAPGIPHALRARKDFMRNPGISRRGGADACPTCCPFSVTSDKRRLIKEIAPATSSITPGRQVRSNVPFAAATAIAAWLLAFYRDAIDLAAICAQLAFEGLDGI